MCCYNNEWGGMRKGPATALSFLKNCMLCHLTVVDFISNSSKIYKTWRKLELDKTSVWLIPLFWLSFNCTEDKSGSYPVVFLSMTSPLLNTSIMLILHLLLFWGYKGCNRRRHIHMDRIKKQSFRHCGSFFPLLFLSLSSVYVTNHAAKPQSSIKSERDLQKL